MLPRGDARWNIVERSTIPLLRFTSPALSYVCSTVVTPNDPGSVASVTTSGNQAYVVTFEGGVAANRSFYLAITC